MSDTIDRQQEVANQEILTKKMQETMAQLDRANRLQEEVHA